MKKKNRMRSLLGMTLLTGAGAAIVWYIDPVGMDRIPRFHNDTDAASYAEPAPEELSDAPQFHSAPLQTVAGEPAEPSTVEDFAFEPEAIDNAKPDVDTVASDNVFHDAFDPTPNNVVRDDYQMTPPELLGNRVSVTDAPIVPVAGTEPQPQAAFENSPITAEQLATIDRMIDGGEEIAAHKKLSAWYWNHPESRPLFQQRIEELAKSIYFSPQPHYEDAYTIQPGDQLRKIAAQYKLSWQYLARLNQVNPRKIRFGQKLKVVRGPFDAVVDLSDYQLTVLCHGQYVRQYRVGIGKDGTSPIGKFTVQDKLEDPVYYGPDGVIANDDPQNPLGERWIDIGDSFGIHGTIDPQSIGKSESRGCIRMLNEDVAEVYDFLTIGSTVWIRR